MTSTVKSRILIAWVCLAVVSWSPSGQAADAGPYKPGPYKTERGAITINAAEGVTLYVPSQDKDLPLRVVFPVEEGTYPVIVFTHGGGRLQFAHSYNLFTDHWASHGYVVIQPTHKDAFMTRADFAALRGQSAAGTDLTTHARLEDLSFILDSLDKIEAAVPELNGKMDRERLVIAGHSRGAAITLIVSGVKLRDPRSGTIQGPPDNRFDAVLFLSEPGNAAWMPKEPWRHIIDKPTLLVTGTNDFGAIANMSVGFQYEVVAEKEPRTDNKHRVFIEDLDQHFGGLVSGIDTVGKGADYDALTIAKGTSTAFLDAYMKADEEALKFLSGDEIKKLSNGRAAFSD